MKKQVKTTRLLLRCRMFLFGDTLKHLFKISYSHKIIQKWWKWGLIEFIIDCLLSYWLFHVSTNILRWPSITFNHEFLGFLLNNVPCLFYYFYNFDCDNNKKIWDPMCSKDGQIIKWEWQAWNKSTLLQFVKVLH